MAINDVHVLRERDRLDIVAALVGYLPEESQMLLAGREAPQLGLARLRAERRFAELGRDELALDVVEAEALLHLVGAELSSSEVAELTRRTEGWAAGVYLASLSLRSGHSLDLRIAGSGVGGPTGYVAEYLGSEVFAHLSSKDRSFLT